MKKCFKCGVVKSLDQFYSHPKMADGHLNKCIVCAKKDVKERIGVLVNDPEFVAAERARGRQKYHRLYHGIKADPEVKKRAMDNYKTNYPEKHLAKSFAASIKCPDGFHKHHWSYKPEHFKDVIIIHARLHMKLHRFMNYDPQERKYRTLEGTLLDTRGLHETFIEIVKQIF